MKRLVALSLLLTVTGCAHWTYRPPAGHPDSANYSDMGYCHAEAGQASESGNRYSSGQIAHDTYIYCLRGKGWTVVKVK